MFDIGFGEMLFLGTIALIAIGPKQLPEVARVVGRTLNEFKRTASEFTRTFTEARDNFDRQVNSFQDSMQETLDKAMPILDEPRAQVSSDEPAHEEPDPNQMHFPDSGEIDTAQTFSAPVALDEHRQLSFDLEDTSNSYKHQNPRQDS